MLTYQVVTQWLQVFVVNNLQYFLYRTPLLAYHLSRLFCRPYISDYKSTGGYIRGLNDPQQGVLMWNYWCDMYEDEECLNLTDPAHLRKFGQLLHKLYAIDRRPFCTSWLGHTLYFEQLQHIFRRHVIICTRRDFLSTALSIAHYTRNERGQYGFYWTSTRPRECQDLSVMSLLSSYERVAWQVYFINRRIDEQAATGRYAIFDSMYSDLCQDPSGFIARLVAFAQTKNIALEPSMGVELPASFTATGA